MFERVLRERDGSSTISQLRDVIPELEAEYAPDILRSPSRSNVLFPFSVVPTDDDGICDARLAPLYQERGREARNERLCYAKRQHRYRLS